LTAKEWVLRAIRALPDDASRPEIHDAVVLGLEVARGKAQIREGRGLSHEEVRERLEKRLP
jgi:hypothetical protein